MNEINRVKEVATVFSLLCDQAGNSQSPNVIERHFQHKIKRNRIAWFERLISFHDASEAV